MHGQPQTSTSVIKDTLEANGRRAGGMGGDKASLEGSGRLTEEGAEMKESKN